jgi:hypothetical protein
MPVTSETTAYALYNASTCSGANEWAIRFSSLNNRFEGCDGSQWVYFSQTPVAVENPATCSTTDYECTNGTSSGNDCKNWVAEWTCTASNGSDVSCAKSGSESCN